MFTTKMEEYFIMIDKSKKATARNKPKSKIINKNKGTKEVNYCKMCGAEIKIHFKIQLTQKRAIDVCMECFDWSMGKTPAQIRTKYKEKNKKKLK